MRNFLEYHMTCAESDCYIVDDKLIDSMIQLFHILSSDHRSHYYYLSCSQERHAKITIELTSCTNAIHVIGAVSVAPNN